MESVSYGLTGFHTPGEYFREVAKLPSLVATRSFHRRTVDDFEDSRTHGTGGLLKKSLTALDIAALGVGMMVGAGVFVTTGAVASTLAGPSVIVSYAVAGLSAFLSALCYSEFAVDFPFAGGAYTYISASMGEFLGFIVVANLIFEYILSGAAAVRSFSPYMAMLCNQPSDFFTTEWNGYVLDWWGLAICLALTVLLVLGAKESARFNLVVTITHLLVMVFIIIAGLTKANGDNFTPFTLPDLGWRGTFNGAAIVFFSYIGFDAVATSGEECRNVSRDMPLGILGAMAVTTTIYVLMATTLVAMVPVDFIPEGASFAAAFKYVGYDWAVYIVALGALMGIVTTTLVGMYAVARIIANVARDHLLPPYLAKVSPRFQTPHISIICQGVATAIIALFTDFADLIDLVSISTLFAFWLVAVGLLWRRSYVHRRTTVRTTCILVAHLLAIIGASLAFTIVWAMELPWPGMVGTGVAAVLISISWFFLCKVEYTPAKFKLPLFPFLPCGSIFLNTFLLGQVKAESYERFAIWCAACVGVYLFYGMPASAFRERLRGRLPGAAEGAAKAEVDLPPAKSVDADAPGVVSG